jgi:dephospho-CoA kinase
LEKIGGNVKIKVSKKIAICGGLASGKTTACQILAEFGAYVVHADLIVHELLAFDPLVVEKVVRAFGEDVLVDGKVCRKKLSQRVFQNPNELGQLEAILHPLVIMEIKRKYDVMRSNDSQKLFVAEIPLMNKVEMRNWFDLIINIEADENVRRERANALGYSNEDFERRLSNQASQESLRTLADVTIHNTGSITDLKQQLKDLLL